MKINNSKTELQNLIDLLVESNPDVEQYRNYITVSDMQPISGEKLGDKTASNINTERFHNTRITIKFDPSQRLMDKTITYRRIEIATQLRMLEFTKGDFNLTDVVDNEIEEHIKTVLIDRWGYIEDSIIVEKDDSANTVKIKAKENSLLYFGEYVINLADPDIELLEWSDGTTDTLEDPNKLPEEIVLDDFKY